MPHMQEHVQQHGESKEASKNHINSYNCPECKYSSLRKDTLKRHSKTHRRQDLLSNLEPPKTPEKTRLETKLYQADPTNMNSYMYQQSLPKNKEIFPWILHKLRYTTKEF